MEEDVKKPEGEGTPKKETPVDWEKRYKDIQADQTRNKQKLSELEGTIENLTPFVDWDKLYGKTPSDTAKPGDEPQYIDRKEFDKATKELERKMQIAELTSEFRATYPDMAKYEKMVTFFLVNQTDQRKKMRDRLDDAVKRCKDFLETERTKGRETAEKEKKEKEEKEASASGLESPKTTPKKKAAKVPGTTYEDYVALRKADQEKMKQG